MAVEFLTHQDPGPAVIAPRLRHRGFARPRPPDAAVPRALLIAIAILGLLAFVLGVGNRFTNGPLFIYIPEVEVIPPLSRAAWQQAFVIHQQSPLFALCGGYQVGGMESLTVYQALYLWEWARAGSVMLLAAGAVLMVALMMRRALRGDGDGTLSRLLAMAAALGAYLGLRYLADHAGLFASLNTGQHRHAVDVTFASVALAVLVAAAVWGPERPRDGWLGRGAWATAIALDIAFGALFEAMDAGAVWKTFPGYADGLLPGADRLFAFQPVWRNLTENVYLIQACHRVLSFLLWTAALAATVTAWWRGADYRRAALLAVLLTVEGGLGAATLMLGLPVVLSLSHQFVGILVLAAAVSPSGLWHRGPGMAVAASRSVVQPVR